MLKYLIVALLAVLPAIPALAATPVTEHGTAVHHRVVSHAHTIHHLTPAQRRARLARLEHERAVKRIAEEHQLHARRTTRRTTVAHRTVRGRTVRHSTVTHETYAQRVTEHRRYEAHRAYLHRVAAHRAYEARLEHERWVRAHPAYEARLKHERRLREHRAYEARLAEQRAERAKVAAKHHDATQLAKADIPKADPVPVSGTVHPASLDYVSHAHIHLYWSSPLRGTLASLMRQDRRDRAEGLTRVMDESELEDEIRDHALVPLPLNGDLQPAPHLAYDRRYTRPWTADFLRDLSQAFMHRFGEPLVITSAVRPVSYQERLTYRNGNAAPANGAVVSPHEYGASVDIGKKGMTSTEIAWMRGYLLPIQKAGQIDVEEEFYQACFHITVYTDYVPAPVAHPQPEMADAQMDASAR